MTTPPSPPLTQIIITSTLQLRIPTSCHITTTTTSMSTSTSDSGMWDPKSQTYIGGIVPSHHTAIDIADLLALNNGKLKIFGYGSLCWHPGADGVLSLANIEEDEHDHDIADEAEAGTIKAARKVTTVPGRAIGYQRCWSQRSADHRGTTEFNGIVCTLLSDEEVWRLHHGEVDNNDNGTQSSIEDATIRRERPSMTEGLIYTVDVDLVDDCLAELDFREKGGYARDVIEVVEDDTGNTVKALLYRGTPDNPAFWKRVLMDLPLAAAIISVAMGPSGPNDIYLLHLHKFLAHAAQHSPAAEIALKDHSGDFHTGELATMVNLLQSEYLPYFLFGAGSNEHGQLLLNSGGSVLVSNNDLDGDLNLDGKNGLDDAMSEVHELTEMLLVVPRQNNTDENGTTEEEPSIRNGNHEPQSLHAGGGHSALLTNGGDLYLWGWNDAGQLGRASTSSSKSTQGGRATSPFNSVQPLSNIKVNALDLGHTHTLVIEKDTGRLFGFGENGRGQVNGRADGSTLSDSCHVAQTPVGLSEERFADVGAGLFHSAAITEQGELITWGCGRFGQCLCPAEVETQGDGAAPTVGRWRPADGSKLVQVACGRRHTVALDEHGRVWTLGDNKYGQLGRPVDISISNAEPQLVDGPLGRVNSGCFAICSGWSHILAITRGTDSKAVTMHGWGRNDKGQLGVRSAQSHVSAPQVLKLSLGSNKIPTETEVDSNEDVISIQSICCGAESSHVIDMDGDIYSTGWNEHGNLATIGDGLSWMATYGVSVVAPPPSKVERNLFAAGGAHIIALAK
mmetsp:Transcript_3704/g.8247  ORF Transcript_3704/g.8247 Transcript_3704/m.8247 type:complete len:792 (-) Transcript_3704:176-2551(-)